MGGARGREVLLTGATGFVGKVVLEALLRRREELEVERVHLLIRPGAGGSARERAFLARHALPGVLDRRGDPYVWGPNAGELPRLRARCAWPEASA